MSVFQNLSQRDRTFREPINWTTSFFMLAFHVGAIAAVFMFSWKALALSCVLWWVAGSLGIGMGYHRLLTHRGYKTPVWVEYFLTVCGTLALEGGPIAWVATHRLHHQNTDKEGDPHSPNDGGLWAHMGWIFHGQSHAPEHRGTSALRPRLAQTRLSPVDQQVSLGAAGDSWDSDFRSGRSTVLDVGDFLSYGLRTALHWLVFGTHIGVPNVFLTRPSRQFLGWRF